jgi:diaminohydroxyphosphoribosylaminopyrimidine deaminase/5-amino-6-(5-phosphoribosylamino)uracil reductase
MGYTQPPGGDHAEVVALKQAEKQPAAPPCMSPGTALLSRSHASLHPRIIEPASAKSFRSHRPQSQSQRTGPERVAGSGLKVYSGEHSEEALELNEAFNKYISTGLPFVTAKFASSLDGKIATRNGDSK